MRTYLKLQMRGIRKSITRYLSILGIVAIGTGFLSGLLVSAPDMKRTVDAYNDEYALMDLNIKGTLGITEDDLEAARAVPGADTVMPARVTDILMTGSDGADSVVRLYGLDLSLRGGPAFLNDFNLTEGRLPVSASEVVLVCPNRFTQPHQLGEVYTLSAQNPDYEDLPDTYLADTFTVVGLADSPRYMTVEAEPSTAGTGRVDLIFYTLPGVYDLDVYTDLFIRLDGSAELNTFTEDYTGLLDGKTPEFEDLGKIRSVIRYEEVVGDATEELDDAQAEFDQTKADTEQDIADAQQKLDDARADLEDAGKELEDHRGEYEDGKSEYDKAYKEYKKQQKDAADEIEKARKKLRSAYSAGMIPQSVYESGMKDLKKSEEDLQRELSSGRGELWKAEDRLNEGYLYLLDAEEKLEDAGITLDEKQQELDEAKADAEVQLADAQKKIDDARRDLEDLEEPEWIVTDRSDMVSYSSYKSNSEKIDAIARVFPLFLFLIAALVALTTMTRMVEEDRVQIGTLKALGYSAGQITAYYLFYSASASLIGSLVGMALGFRVLPAVISQAYSMMYVIPPILTSFEWKTAAVIAAVAVVCTTGAAYLACRSELREKPSLLLLPKAPKSGKRILLEHIGFIWKHLKFSQKVTCRNIFRYKKRLFMTTLGIAGCTALLITGFGLRDSINDIVEKQFFDLYQFDCTVYLRSSDSMDKHPEIREYLDASGSVRSYMRVHTESGTVRNARGETEDTSIYVPEDPGSFPSYIRLRDRKTRVPVPFGSSSCVLTEKMCETLHLSVGDSFTLVSSDRREAVLTVTGITENYVTSYVFLPEEAYRNAFREEPEYDRLIVSVSDTGTETENRISSELLRLDDVSLVSFNSSIRASFDNLIGNVNFIIYVLIASAGALAVLVLYNLTNINISERKKELATIKVLGFYEGEVAGYIFRETTILSLLGILFGFGFGIWLHAFVVSTAEVDAVMFGRVLYPRSFLISAAITVFFTGVVDLIMIPKIRRINMVESMKANE